MTALHMLDGSGSKCGNANASNWASSWLDVTCKRCLKHRPPPIVPFADPILIEWGNGINVLTSEWLGPDRSRCTALKMFESLVECVYELGPFGAGDDEQLHNALFDDLARLRVLLRERLEGGGS